MNLLLDTSVVIWLGEGNKRLSKSARNAISTATAIYVSPLTIAELSIKSRKGKLNLGTSASSFVGAICTSYGLEFLVFDHLTANLMDTIPIHHDDPFDRMLICQAIANNLDIVTPDVQIAKYPIKTIW